MLLLVAWAHQCVHCPNKNNNGSFVCPGPGYTVGQLADSESCWTPEPGEAGAGGEHHVSHAAGSSCLGDTDCAAGIAALISLSPVHVCCS